MESTHFPCVLQDGDMVRISPQYFIDHPSTTLHRQLGYKFWKTKPKNSKQAIIVGCSGGYEEIDISYLEKWEPMVGDIVSVTHPDFLHTSIIMFGIHKVDGDLVTCFEYGDFGLYNGAEIEKEYVVPFNLKEYINYPVMWRDAKFFFKKYMPEAIEILEYVES